MHNSYLMSWQQQRSCLLLVNPVGRRELVLRDALGEPESDLLLAVLDRVGAVAWASLARER